MGARLVTLRVWRAQLACPRLARCWSKLGIKAAQLAAHLHTTRTLPWPNTTNEARQHSIASITTTVPASYSAVAPVVWPTTMLTVLHAVCETTKQAHQQSLLQPIPIDQQPHVEDQQYKDVDCCSTAIIVVLEAATTTCESVSPGHVLRFHYC